MEVKCERTKSIGSTQPAPSEASSCFSATPSPREYTDRMIHKTKGDAKNPSFFDACRSPAAAADSQSNGRPPTASSPTGSLNLATSLSSTNESTRFCSLATNSIKREENVAKDRALALS